VYLPSRLLGASRHPCLLSLHWLFSLFWLFYWAIAQDFSVVFSKMGLTSPQKLQFWGSFFHKKIISRSPRKIELLFFLLPTLTTKSIASAQFWGFFRVCGALEGSGNLVLRAPFLLVLMVTCPMYLPSRLSGASRYPRLLPLHWLFFTFLAVYWAIAHDFSAVFSKMGITFAQKLRLWRSFFSRKDNFNATEKKSTILLPIAHFDPQNP
jgi:hypothetical protein